MHRERGDRLVLLTSSSPYLSRHVQAELDLDDFICTRFEVINGVHTGKPERPMAFGPGKVTLARAMADREGVDLADCHFYSDSMSDLPMLEAVGHPVVVHPDHKLNRLAKRRGWLVQDWGAA